MTAKRKASSFKAQLQELAKRLEAGQVAPGEKSLKAQKSLNRRNINGRS